MEAPRWETPATLEWLAKISDTGVAAAVDRLNGDQGIALTEQFGTHNYHPLPINVARAEGAKVWDHEGREYIDCVGAYSAVSHGHLNPALIRAATEQLHKVALPSRALYSSELGLFLKGLCEYAQMDKACPMNSGVEAVETAIKLARKWGYEKKGIPDDQATIIVAEGNFHGRTTTVVGFSSEPNYKRHFGPFAPGFVAVPFGDIDALKSQLGPHVCAVLLEPIQGEGGIIMPPSGYMAEVRKACDAANVLLIWDEIQTGFARTGKAFAWMHEAAAPNMITVGKALGGGLYPVSAVVGREAVMGLFQPGDHGSTFGGNPLAAAIGLAALAEIVAHDYAGQATAKGEVLTRRFREMKAPGVVEVRGRGLMIGLEVSLDGAAVTEAFLANGIISKETRHRTFRFAPPITTPMETVHEIADRVERALLTIS